MVLWSFVNVGNNVEMNFTLVTLGPGVEPSVVIQDLLNGLESLHGKRSPSKTHKWGKFTSLTLTLPLGPSVYKT